MASLCSWHVKVHFCLVSQITHSRNSFIFSKQIKDEDENIEYSKRSIDIETVSEKLKYKIYSNINEFYDEVNKMIRYFKEYMMKRNSILWFIKISKMLIFVNQFKIDCSSILISWKLRTKFKIESVKLRFKYIINIFSHNRDSNNNKE